MMLVTLPPRFDLLNVNPVMSPMIRTWAPNIAPCCAPVSLVVLVWPIVCSCSICCIAARSSTMNRLVRINTVVSISVRPRANSLGGGIATVTVVWVPGWGWP